ncbi:MAG: hypothetical protein FJ147_03615 [Deltaproteobacteria bacterium]|nr:hypothetical protein [Deltaproteobacteria bacterium]
MAVLKIAAVYFSLVFGTGFVLGILRVLVLVPLVGTRAAELIEMPFMLLAIMVAARWLYRRFATAITLHAWLAVGLLAMGLVLVADVFVGVGLRGMALTEVMFNRDPVSGTVYYVLLVVFALMPYCVARFFPKFSP